MSKIEISINLKNQTKEELIWLVKQLKSNLDIYENQLKEIKDVFDKSSMFQTEELLEIDECYKILKVFGIERED